MILANHYCRRKGILPSLLCPCFVCLCVCYPHVCQHVKFTSLKVELGAVRTDDVSDLSKLPLASNKASVSGEKDSVQWLKRRRKRRLRLNRGNTPPAKSSKYVHRHTRDYYYYFVSGKSNQLAAKAIINPIGVKV